MKKYIKNDNAITLVTLVVTIIVLLILAGISISMLTGDNGILTKAQQAKEEQKLGEALENIKLELQSAQTEIISQSQKVNFYNVGTILENKGYVCEYTSSPIASLDPIAYTNFSYMKVSKDNFTFVIDQNMKIVYKPEILIGGSSGSNSSTNSGLQTSEVITNVSLSGTAISNTEIDVDFSVSESEKTYLSGFWIICNGEVKNLLDSTKTTSKILDLIKNHNYEIYCIALDKYGKVCQSEKINISTLNIDQFFLYNLGDSCTSVTNGWTLTRDSYSNFITESNSIHAQRTGGSYGGWAISTNLPVNISSYKKLCCKYTAGANAYGDGLRLKLHTSKYTYQTGSATGATYYSDSFTYSQENGIFTWDVSQITDGSYYIGIGGSGASDTYIYQMWFEE